MRSQHLVLLAKSRQLIGEVAGRRACKAMNQQERFRRREISGQKIVIKKGMAGLVNWHKRPACFKKGTQRGTERASEPVGLRSCAHTIPQAKRSARVFLIS